MKNTKIVPFTVLPDVSTTSAAYSLKPAGSNWTEVIDAIYITIQYVALYIPKKK